MRTLIYQTSPVVGFASNIFHNVPVILQFDDTPLMSVVREQALGYTTEIPIYHSDGTCLVKVRGTRVFTTEAGKNAGVEIRHLPGMTVCALDGRTAFEIAHAAGDAFHLQAELHTPNGQFLKVRDGLAPGLFTTSGQALTIGGITITGNTFVGCRIAVWLKSNGSCAIGCN